MDITELLREKQSAVARRWVEGVCATYPNETAGRLARGKDRFGNPLGHALRAGAEEIVGNAIGGIVPEKVCGLLENVIRIRAVQEFAPSEAVSFIFLLKDAARGELGGAAGDPRHAAGLAEFDARVDQLALFAFDIYAKCRERLYDIRVNELKMNVAAIIRRVNRGGGGAGPEGGGESEDADDMDCVDGAGNTAV